MIERKILAAAAPGSATESGPAQLERDGSFTGYASTYDEDAVGDAFAFEAWDAIGTKGATFPLLDHHKTDVPLGVIHVSRNLGGLYAQGKPNLEVARAREMVALMRQGAVTGLSVGFVTKDSYRKGGVRYITKAELHEVSLCTFPCNPKARILSVKACGLRDLDRLIRDIRDYTKAIRRRAA
jgi:HK97 family phage prohead protease